jgi:hypothetical protein
MQALAQAFHRLGFEDARTYINSGNVIFSSKQRSGDKLAEALEEGLAPLLGFRAEAFVRTADELQALAQRAAAMGCPLPAGAEVNVCFLPVVATPEHAAAVALLKSDIDDFEVHGRRSTGAASPSSPTASSPMPHWNAGSAPDHPAPCHHVAGIGGRVVRSPFVSPRLPDQRKHHCHTTRSAAAWN